MHLDAGQRHVGVLGQGEAHLVDEVLGHGQDVGAVLDDHVQVDMHARFGYRVVKARWAGKSKGSLYPITLTVIGHDDIGIVNNITSIISKEENIQLRNISINSHDGLFSGTLTVLIEENARLQALVKKLRTVKGVKQVNRN